jgi:nucleotide-binding universal stress UspA family protein
MSIILAAIDSSAAAGPVLATADAIARRLGWDVEAVHVRVDGDVGAREAAAAAGIELTELEGSPAGRIRELARREEVAALVLGSRGLPGANAFGSTALELVTDLDKPIVVVPPGARAMDELRRILIPLDATDTSAEALERGLDLLCAADVELVVLHVQFGASLPMFEDQPQHETSAWTQEFLSRYCPVAPEGVQFELRTGRPGGHVVDVAAEAGVQLIALGWKQEVAPGRAAVVREVLMRSPTPVVLFPLPRAGTARPSRVAERADA